MLSQGFITVLMLNYVGLFFFDDQGNNNFKLSLPIYINYYNGRILNS